MLLRPLGYSIYKVFAGHRACAQHRSYAVQCLHRLRCYAVHEIYSEYRGYTQHREYSPQKTLRSFWLLRSCKFYAVYIGYAGIKGYVGYVRILGHTGNKRWYIDYTVYAGSRKYSVHRMSLQKL